MLDFQTCKTTLNEGNKTYTDEEVKLVSELLYHLALLTVETYHDLSEEKA